MFYLIGVMNQVSYFSHWRGVLVVTEERMVITNRWQRAFLIFDML